MIRRSGTSLIPPSTKGYKQSIGSVCSPHMAMRETCPHEKLWVFQTVWWAKLKHDEYIRLDLLVTWGHEVVISLIQYLSFVLKLFGSHRHGHSGCSSHFFGSDTGDFHVNFPLLRWGGQLFFGMKPFPKILQQKIPQPGYIYIPVDSSYISPPVFGEGCTLQGGAPTEV